MCTIELHCGSQKKMCVGNHPNPLKLCNDVVASAVDGGGHAGEDGGAVSLWMQWIR